MKALITGKSGQLGRELLLTRPGGWTIDLPDSKSLDLTRPGKVMDYVRRCGPDLIINAAGYTAVDQAESEAGKAYAVNCDGVAALAEAAVKTSAGMVHISTDYVFDGRKPSPYRPGDRPNPLNVYGSSKLAGEQRFQESGCRGLVIRTSWLYSAFGQNFVTTMLKLMNSRDHLGVVDDQVGSPTWAKGLADVIWLAVSKKLTGLYHWSDGGQASWFDLASAVYEEACRQGILTRQVNIQPIPGSQYRTAARRPAFSVLDETDLAVALGVEPRNWRRNLARLMSDLSQPDKRKKNEVNQS